MKFKLFILALSMAIVAASGHAQSVIGTILGDIPGAPNGVPALSVGLNLPSATASDGKGNVYVALRGSHQVVRIDSSGILRLVAGTGVSGGQGPAGDGGPATSATLSIPLAMAFDSSGNLYIADAGANRIRMVNTSGIISTFAGNGNDANAGDGGLAINASLDGPSGIAFDLNGNLLIADTGNDNIRMVSPAGIITKVAGTGNPAFDGPNGTAATAAFSLPTGVAVDHLGNIYISDTGNQLVRMISTAGITSVIAGTPSKRGSFGDGRQANTAELNNPGAILFDTAGNLYIADVGNDRVRRVTSNGVISNYAGSGTIGAGGDGGYAIAANINLQSIAMDPQNNLYIADGGNFRVREVTASNGFITTIAGNGLDSYNPTNLLFNNGTVYFSDSTANRIRQFNLAAGAASIGVFAGNGQETWDAADDVALTARLNGPRGLSIDSKGNIYFADSKNFVVREITPEGALVNLAGNAINIDTGDGALATAAQLSGPVDVAFANGSGNLYILEQAGERIRVITPNGNIATYAGTGVPGTPTSITGTATSLPVNGPQGLAIDSSGTLYIADTGNNLIRTVTTAGNMTTIIGNGAPGYTGDGGPALSASVRNPTGVAVDSFGNIFIADTRNNVIREVGTDGIISTVAGTGTAGYNGDGSPATSFQLNQPSAIAIGPSCSVLVADVANQRIRQVFPSVAYSVTTNPSGLQILADGQTVNTPAVLNWLPGTSHQLSGPASQSGAPGTQYALTSAAQSISVPCGSPRASASVSFATQYFLTVTAGNGGTVSQTSSFEAAGSSVTLTASPSAGFVFSGWQGVCSGTGSCQVTMTGPMSVSAQFAAAAQSRRFTPKPRP
jgi:trimeric autotransporter adhesin